MNDSIFYFFYNLLDHQSAFESGVIIFFADILPYVMGAVLGGFYFIVVDPENDFTKFIKKHRVEILGVFFSVILSTAVAYGLKIFFHTPRPFDALPGVVPLLKETGFAFPSGHAAFFMAIAISVFYFHKKFGGILVLLAILIGIARIMAGVHFPIDIIGGSLLGGSISFLFTKLFDRS